MQFSDYLVETISLILLPVAVLMCAYALTVFIWRARAIAKKQVASAMNLWKITVGILVESSRDTRRHPASVMRCPRSFNV